MYRSCVTFFSKWLSGSFPAGVASERRRGVGGSVRGYLVTPPTGPTASLLMAKSVGRPPLELQGMAPHLAMA